MTKKALRGFIVGGMALVMCGCSPRYVPPPQGSGWRIEQQRYHYKSVQTGTEIQNNPNGSIQSISNYERSRSELANVGGTPCQSVCLPSGTEAASVTNVDWSTPLKCR